jgi:hypothetical protein
MSAWRPSRGLSATLVTRHLATPSEGCLTAAARNTTLRVPTRMARYDTAKETGTSSRPFDTASRCRIHHSTDSEHRIHNSQAAACDLAHAGTAQRSSSRQSTNMSPVTNCTCFEHNEDHVIHTQVAVCDYLRRHDYRVDQRCHTMKQGVDIIATHDVRRHCLHNESNNLLGQLPPGT